MSWKMGWMVMLGVLLWPSSGQAWDRIRKTEVVAGMVIDADTEQAIAGAKVMFVDRRDTLTRTDQDGDFICGPGFMKIPFTVGIPITFAPETRIQISAKGYQTKIVQAYRRVEWTRKSQMPPPKVLVIRLQER